jgi:hypothetical protein
MAPVDRSRRADAARDATGPRPPGPWFEGRASATVVVVLLLFLAVFVLRFVLDDVADALSMLYVLPVALVAVAFGARAGAVAGATALALTVVWTVADDVTISWLGWVAHALPLLLLGYLLGDATDRARRADAARRALEDQSRRHRDAVEINDMLVQGMAAAKWALEAGRLDDGLELLTRTMRTATQLVSELLRSADMAPAGRRAAGVRPPDASGRDGPGGPPAAGIDLARRHG